MKNGITFYSPELKDTVRIYFHNQNFKMKKLFLLPILSVVLGSSFLSTAKADYCYRTNHSYGNGYSQSCSNGSSSSYYDDNNDGVYKRNIKSYGYSGGSGGYKYPSTGINGFY